MIVVVIFVGMVNSVTVTLVVATTAAVVETEVVVEAVVDTDGVDAGAAADVVDGEVVVASLTYEVVVV